ncbi:hypothetical protein AURDEDRAFT_165779 [Auricularia subglabra TFB-10046 SS5]|nr:hypothetical protein AURDEDRAFT_165779 [Auricularia subglabra TFB-10046 SS5]
MANVHLARVWLTIPSGVVRKFLVYFSTVIGGLPDDRPHVDRAFLVAVRHDERLYSCIHNIPFAQAILFWIRGHLADVMLHPMRVVRLSLDVA